MKEIFVAVMFVVLGSSVVTGEQWYEFENEESQELYVLICAHQNERYRDLLGEWLPIRLYSLAANQNFAWTTAIDLNQESRVCGLELKIAPVIDSTIDTDLVQSVVRYKKLSDETLKEIDPSVAFHSVLWNELDGYSFQYYNKNTKVMKEIRIFISYDIELLKREIDIAKNVAGWNWKEYAIGSKKALSGPRNDL
ncbi:MAG: hypothetical protein CML13_17195 [Puniceicoccaceae bacterium]|nr:hypothetical protein [Puniceicoccaceae bacterium]|tara:strand:- start:229 stop:813 length:585 start_codon:yes stop_codon:yes gene_type:complete